MNTLVQPKSQKPKSRPKFKEYDNYFTKTQIVDCRRNWLIKGEPLVNQWPWIVGSWRQEFVQHCVYEAADHKDWQLFRVAMKGLSTKEKLTMLKHYMEEHCSLALDQAEYNLHKCRVDNYMGALKRGGFVDHNYKVVR